MSRIGREPVKIPDGVSVEARDGAVAVKGKRGELTLAVPAPIEVAVAGGEVLVTRPDEKKESRSLHGTVRSLIANMIEGVMNGYRRDLEIEGVGYRASMQGRKLVMSVGYSHSIEYEAPEGVEIEVTDNTKVAVKGIDKQAVGHVSARIRAFCKAEPYKGKGIRYKGERIRRKVGKTVA
jgi:large subunit ribosomal protein L6